MNGICSHQSARSQAEEWLTPPEILTALGPFDLDPCAPRVRPYDMAAEHIDISQNGLACAWRGHVWLNPPYGRNTGHWLSKLADHSNGIALIFARTETKVFIEQVWSKADSLLFIHGRLHFHRLDGTRGKTNAGAPSVLIGYGPRATDKLRTCNIKGTFINNWRQAT